MSRTLREEQSFTGKPELSELNETLRRFQGNVGGMGDLLALSMQTRLRPQPELTQSGYKARPGIFLPVTAETSVLLTKPTPDTAGLPLAIFNASGGVVTLDPVDCKLNAVERMGWLSPGLTVLWPDASGWFGGNTRIVEFFDVGTLIGNATGAVLTVGSPATDPDVGLGRFYVLAYAQQGTSGVGPVTFGKTNFDDRGANTLTTVRIDVLTAFERVSRGSGASIPAQGTSLLGFLSWLTGADQDRGLATAIATDSTGTTVSADVTTIRPGAMILDFMANDDATDTGTPGTGQTELVDGSAGGATVSLQASYKPMPRPGTTTMGWEDLTAATNKAHLALVVEPGEGP